MSLGVRSRKRTTGNTLYENLDRAAYGGGYYSDGLACRSGDRWGNSPTNSLADVGFRPVRTHSP